MTKGLSAACSLPAHIYPYSSVHTASVLLCQTGLKDSQLLGHQSTPTILPTPFRTRILCN